MQLTSHNVKQFQTKILTWFAKNKRDLPWRPPTLKLRKDKAPDFYHIIVSEVMLQQTQVSRVLPKYHEWLKTFPTLRSLAKAKTSEVLRLWSGLGYNRRALYLKKTAEILSKHYKQYKNYNYYKDEKTLRTLPGIGEYTARATLCFAFNKQVAVVDTNIKRVILTQTQISKLKSQNLNKKEIQKIADILLPKGRVLRLRSGRLLPASAYEWNQALMDYASAMLQKEKVPIPKQSKFIGSNRYYRGQIIQLLLQTRKIEKEKLRAMLKKEGSNAWLDTILSGLVKDGFIHVSKNTITLVS